MNFLADVYYPHLKKYLFNRLHSVLVVARGIFCCGVWDLVSWPVIKPRSLHWEHRVLATRPPGKSQITLLSVRRFILGRKDMTNLSSVQFSRSVVSDSLRPHESQHARPPCPSATPGVHSDSCPLSPWCHPAISSLVVPFSSCPQSFQASESFPMSQLFSWGGQSIGVSATGYNNLSYIANSRFSCIHSTNANASPWFKYYRWPSPQKRYVC